MIRSVERSEKVRHRNGSDCYGTQCERQCLSVHRVTMIITCRELSQTLATNALAIFTRPLSAWSSSIRAAPKLSNSRFFGGLTEQEISALLDISVPTVKRDWEFARSWLLSQIE
jgi:ECF sigma factor